MSVNKSNGLIVILRYGLSHAQTGLQGLLSFCDLCMLFVGMWYCVSRMLTEKPLCYSRICPTQQFNNWPSFPLICIPQEAVPFDVCSCIFILSHFLELFGFRLKSVTLIERYSFSSELNLLQETFKMILSNKLSRHFPSLESAILQVGIIICLLIPRY